MQKTSPARFPLDFWIAAAVLVFSTTMFVEALGYPDKAGTFPIIILTSTMALCVYIMAVSFWKRRGILLEGALDWEAVKKTRDLKAAFILGVLVSAYVLASPFIGFGLSTMLYLGSGIYLFGERNKITIIAVPAAVLLFVYVFFFYFLNVRIPMLPAF